MPSIQKPSVGGILFWCTFLVYRARKYFKQHDREKFIVNKHERKRSCYLVGFKMECVFFAESDKTHGNLSRTLLSPKVC